MSAFTMHAAFKLLAGLAATVVVARGAGMHHGQAMLAELGLAAQAAMVAHGISDGSVRWRGSDGRVSRIARLSGTADAATRARVIAALERHPGIQSAVWEER